MQRPILKLAGLALVLVLSGCVTPPQRTGEGAAPVPGAAREIERERGGEQADPWALPGAVRSLVQRAEAASNAGDHAAAAAQLERALAIVPRHPVIWQNLAVVRYREGNYQQAESLALRSNSLAKGLPALQQRNWTLIETARRLSGDEAGARKAAVELERLGVQR